MTCTGRYSAGALHRAGFGYDRMRASNRDRRGDSADISEHRRAGRQIRKIAFAGIIGSLYAALTIALGFIGYGPLQFRIAEALCILPFFMPVSVWGLLAGCIAANLLSPYPLDVVVGSFATLLAALCTMWIGRSRGGGGGVARKILACAPPVLFNAVFIGALIAYYTAGADEPGVYLSLFAINALQVGCGEAVVMYAIGLPLMVYLPKTRVLEIIGGSRS